MKGLNDELTTLSDRLRAQQRTLEQNTAAQRELQQQCAAARKRADEAELALTSARAHAQNVDTLTTELRGRDGIIKDLQERLERARKEAAAQHDAQQHKALDESSALQEERAAHMRSQKLAHERESTLLAQITGMSSHTAHKHTHTFCTQRNMTHSSIRHSMSHWCCWRSAPRTCVSPHCWFRSLVCTRITHSTMHAHTHTNAHMQAKPK